MSYAAFQYEVSGEVQGVFFRAYASKEAERLGVVGWIQNTPKGTVKGEIQGSPDKVKEMKNWLQNTGSPVSHIEKASITDERSGLSALSFDTFETRR